MSLHQLAQHMQSAGRGDDKMLVHMTPGEVHGLQKLALAHGGSLTINPETGLPEAGFLSSLLPTLLGAGLTIASGGALSPLMAAGLVGGGTALATGSLEKGLMAGLGAYGGAGFGAGLGSLGGAAASAGTTAGSAAATEAAKVAALPIQGSANIVPTITKGAANAVGAVPGLNEAGAFTGYKSAALGQMPIQTRGAAQASEAADKLINDYELLNPIKAADTASIDITNPITERAVISPSTIKTGSYGQIDATKHQPFISGNIAPVSASSPATIQMPPSQMPVDATRQQLFRTQSPYTPQMPGDATAGRLFENQSPYTPLGGADAIDLGTSVPIEDRSGMQNILRNAADTPDTSSDTMRGLKKATSSWQGLKDLYGEMDKKAQYSAQALGFGLLSGMNERPKPPKGSKSLIRPYTLKRNRVVDSDVGPSSSAERRYFNDVYTAGTPYEAPGPEYRAMGGLASLANGGPVEEMSQQNAVGANTGYPMAQQALPTYSGMSARPLSENMLAPPGDTNIDPYTGEERFAEGGGIVALAGGGTQSASNTYRDGSGFDVSGAAEALGGELPQYEYLGNNKYRLKNPVATSAAPKLSPTGQPVDASGGYVGQYGQYINAQGVAQPYYMNPSLTGPEIDKVRKVAGVTVQSPTSTTTAASAPVTTQEGLEALYQQNFGRAADTSGIESYLGKGYTPEQITGFMQSSEEYKPIKERLEQEAKQATYANPTQIANIYSDVLGRNPDMGGLDYYTGQNLTPDEVKQQLMQSEEYKTNLTKPFVPAISYTGSRLSYDDINKQLGHNATYEEVKAAHEAFIPNRATIQGAPEYQTPEQQLGLAPTKPRDQTPDFYGMMDEELRKQGGYANGGDVQGYNLGGYSDGGRLLRGPGDGVSDDIPATIGNRQPARLADGEFVIPARIVSELGNGSTEAGAKRLYAMMDRVQKARSKTTGKGKIAVNSKADKHLPA